MLSDTNIPRLSINQVHGVDKRPSLREPAPHLAIGVFATPGDRDFLGFPGAKLEAPQ